MNTARYELIVEQVALLTPQEQMALMAVILGRKRAQTADAESSRVSINDFRGLLSGKTDGQDYQKQIRAEWDREWDKS
ncbi:MAG: hypothetical protein K1X67_08765 [Fimbriimonadaceae bacterium]|nr:hypothetical protein [Fimbriimonadaceae bacterium]